MKRKELEKYLGKKVRIRLFEDKKEYVGYLYRGGMKLFREHPSLYYRNNFYFLMPYEVKSIVMPCEDTSSCLFRCSYVAKLEEI